MPSHRVDTFIKSTLPRLRQHHGKGGGKKKGGEIWNSDFQEFLGCCTFELRASGLPAQDLYKIGPISSLSWKGEGLTRSHLSQKIYKQLMVGGVGRDIFFSGESLVRCLPTLL